MGAISCAVFLGLGGGVFYFLQRDTATPPAQQAASATAAPGADKAAVAAAPNPFQKNLEVVGLRLTSQDMKPAVKFLVVNHSGAEISGLAGEVTLWLGPSRAEKDQVGTLTFKTKSIGPFGSQEFTEALTTRFKAYELPDWQNLTAQIQVTSPQP